MASLNPLWRVEQIIAEPLEIHFPSNRTENRKRVLQLLEQVQLSAELLERRPAKLSGGQRQRVAIARALALNPALVICDEAVSALDLGVQAAILELLAELQKQLNLAYLFITHDLAVVQEIADRIVVLKDSRIVEAGTVAEVFSAPKDPYTRRLLEAAPKIPFLQSDSNH
jgi:peptide/nickel transport system ATP-binding protein